jgi:DNA-binding NarL/FixJ family response regulator
MLSDDHGRAGELCASLNSSPDIRAVPSSERARADFVVALAAETSDELMAEMRRNANGTIQLEQRMILVANHIHRRHLPEIFRCGVVSMLPLRELSPEAITSAAITSYHGGAMLPTSVTRWLVDAARTYVQDVLAPNGLEVGGLTPREVEILRLLADGKDTLAIAEFMNYSERTIKKDIQFMLSRLDLHNRVEAVSYAFRVGAIA